MVGWFGGMVCRCRGVILGCRSMVFGGSGVMSLSLIGDIGNKSVVPIGVVGDVLDPSIRQVDGVGAFHIARSVAGLTSTEHGFRVVVSHGVAVGIGEDLVGIVGWLGMVGGFHWGVIGRGCVVCWCRGGVRGSRVGRCRGGRCWSCIGW